jgi:hypothetical protein
LKCYVARSFGDFAAKYASVTSALKSTRADGVLIQSALPPDYDDRSGSRKHKGETIMITETTAKAPLHQSAMHELTFSTR